MATRHPFISNNLWRAFYFDWLWNLFSLDTFDRWWRWLGLCLFLILPFYFANAEFLLWIIVVRSCYPWAVVSSKIKCTGGRQADATVMAATAAASARSATRTSNMLLRRSGSLMDFNGELFINISLTSPLCTLSVFDRLRLTSWFFDFSSYHNDR